MSKREIWLPLFPGVHFNFKRCIGEVVCFLFLCFCHCFWKVYWKCLKSNNSLTLRCGHVSVNHRLAVECSVLSASHHSSYHLAQVGACVQVGAQPDLVLEGCANWHNQQCSHTNLVCQFFLPKFINVMLNNKFHSNNFASVISYYGWSIKGYSCANNYVKFVMR